MMYTIAQISRIVEGSADHTRDEPAAANHPTYTAKQIGRMRGNNPMAQYFDFDPQLFDPIRVPAILASGKKIIGLSGSKKRAGDVLETNLTAVYSTGNNATNPVTVSVFTYRNRDHGFVEISTEDEAYAATPEYKSMVGKLTNSGAKVAFGPDMVKIIRGVVSIEKPPVMPTAIMVEIIARGKKR